MDLVRISPPVIIFVKPLASGNIGALARVMSNFRCTELRIAGTVPVGDADEDYSKMDWALACKGESVLKDAKVFASLREALEGIHVAVGTSGKKDNFERGYARPFKSPTQAFSELSEELKVHEGLKWALVFGTESDGLNSEEAGLCKQLIQIDTVDESPSINIAMAAGMLLYHWHLFNKNEIAPQSTPYPSSAFLWDSADIPSTLADKEKWLDYLIETLKHTQFFKYPDHDGLKARMRRWLQSFQVPQGELLLAFEVIYQMKSWAQGRFGERDFLDRKRS
jgi:TrmH family RNA methyltransferase